MAEEETGEADGLTITDEEIAQLKSVHGEVVGGEIEGCGTFVFKAPSRLAYETFINGVAGDGKAEAMRMFVRSCMVWPVGDDGKPARAQLDAALNLNPGAVEDFLVPVKALAGKATSVKKL